MCFKYILSKRQLFTLAFSSFCFFACGNNFEVMVLKNVGYEVFFCFIMVSLSCSWWQFFLFGSSLISYVRYLLAVFFPSNDIAVCVNLALCAYNNI